MFKHPNVPKWPLYQTIGCLRPASDGATFPAISGLLAGCSLAFPRSTRIAEIGSGSKQASNSEQFKEV